MSNYTCELLLTLSLTEVNTNRTITLTTDDFFSKIHDGTIIKHTGVGCYGIHIPDEDLEEIFEQSSFIYLVLDNFLCIAFAAILPDPIAWITVAAPVTMSPPA